MAKETSTTRVFTKDVGGETLTRHVTSPQAEVEALFDGFTEQKSGSKTSSASTSTSSGGSRSSSSSS